MIGEIWARRLVLFHAALLLLMLVSLANAGRPDPVYLLPLSAAGITSVFTYLTGILLVFLGLFSVPVVVYCFIAWKSYIPALTLYYFLIFDLKKSRCEAKIGFKASSSGGR